MAPASAIVVSHRRPKQLGDIYRKVLIDSARFSTSQNPLFQLFNSQRFQSNDLRFSNSTILILIYLMIEHHLAIILTKCSFLITSVTNRFI